LDEFSNVCPVFVKLDKLAQFNDGHLLMQTGSGLLECNVAAGAEQEL
jgi:hypothetical protein